MDVLARAWDDERVMVAQRFGDHRRGARHRTGAGARRLPSAATVVVPLAPAQWSPLYGMLRDRFGITWVVDVALDDPS